jgi:hypothetical protein
MLLSFGGGLVMDKTERMTQPQTEAGRELLTTLRARVARTRAEENIVVESLLTIEAQAAEPWQAKVAALNEMLLAEIGHTCEWSVNEGGDRCKDEAVTGRWRQGILVPVCPAHSDLTAAANWITEHDAAKDAQIAALENQVKSRDRILKYFHDHLGQVAITLHRLLERPDDGHGPIWAREDIRWIEGTALHQTNATWKAAQEAERTAYTEQVRRDEREKVLSVERIADLIHSGKIVVGPWHPSPHVALSCRRIEDRQEAAALHDALLADSKEGES